MAIKLTLLVWDLEVFATSVREPLWHSEYTSVPRRKNLGITFYFRPSSTAFPNGLFN